MIKLNCTMNIESDLLSYKNDMKLSKVDMLLNSVNNLPNVFFKEYYRYLKLVDDSIHCFSDKEEYKHLKSESDNLYILLNEKYKFNPYFNLLNFDYLNEYSMKGIYCQSIPLNELFHVNNGCYDGWYSFENGIYYFNVCYYDEILKHNITESYLNNEILSLEISIYNEEYFLNKLKNICESKFGEIGFAY